MIQEAINRMTTCPFRAGAPSLLTAAVGNPQDVRSWPVWDALHPHVRALGDFADKRGIAEPTIFLMDKLGLLLLAKAQRSEAEPLMRRVLVIFF